MSKKKTKRIISLVLALTLMFALAAMTASAATARNVICPNCKSGNTIPFYRSVTIRNVTVAGCTSVSGYHIHSVVDYQKWLRCNDCKYEEYNSSVYQYEVCRG